MFDIKLRKSPDGTYYIKFELDGGTDYLLEATQFQALMLSNIYNIKIEEMDF